MRALMTATTYDCNSGLNFGHKQKATCIFLSLDNCHPDLGDVWAMVLNSPLVLLFYEDFTLCIHFTKSHFMNILQWKVQDNVTILPNFLLLLM